MMVERIRSPSVRNEARDEEEAAAAWSDGERSGRIEITSATERTGRRRRRRYAERGTWADRTRRAVARAHKLKPAPRRHCCLLRSTAPARPSSHALPHPPYRPSLRHPLWCPPNQPHPVPRRATPLLLLPPPPPLPPSLPPSPPRCLSTHRPAKPLVAVPPSHPTYRLPPLPGRLRSSPLRPPTPPACRPTPLRFARLRSRSLLSSDCRPRCGPRPFPSPAPCPATTSRRPASPPSGKPAHPKAVCAVEHDRQLRDYLLSDRMSRVYACERMRKG